jgi:hypothetical protein
MLPQVAKVIRNKSKHLMFCPCKCRAYVVQSKIHPPFFIINWFELGFENLNNRKNKLIKFYKYLASSWVLYAPERPLALGP